MHDKEKRIRTEQLRLNKIYCDLDDNKLNLVKPLIERVAFMTVTMRDLEQIMNDKGVTEIVVDKLGNEITKKTTESDLYLSINKNYLIAVKQLEGMCPAAKAAEKSKLAEFC